MINNKVDHRSYFFLFFCPTLYVCKWRAVDLKLLRGQINTWGLIEQEVFVLIQNLYLPPPPLKKPKTI
jgi:hypothetical protein